MPSLTLAQLDRAIRAEAFQLRMLQMQRMSHQDVRLLLGGDPVVAAPWVECAAEFGLPAAEVRYGRMLLAGTGIGADPARALRWFTRAAEQGDTDAMNMVGRCHENGWGAPKDCES